MGLLDMEDALLPPTLPDEEAAPYEAEAGGLADAAAVVELAEVETEAAYMLVACPDGVAAGELIVVDTPDGQDLEVEVPEGIEGGMEFEVAYTPATDATPAERE